MFTDDEIQTDPILKFFSYEHLPHKLQDTSREFAGMAKWVVNHVPRSAERTVSLRKLLEAKDAAVRGSLD
jgi:hypothetical protein